LGTTLTNILKNITLNIKEYNMECNEKVYKLLKEFSYEQNIQFALSCLERIRHIYPLFLNSNQYGIEYLIKEIMPKNEFEVLINSVIYELENNALNIEKEHIDKINKKLELLDELLLDDDIESSAESSIFFQIILTIINILEYIQDKDIDSIELCSDNIIKLIGLAKSNEYYKDNQNASDEEVNKYVDFLIDKEIEVQIEIIQKIKTIEEKEKRHKYIENSKIEYKM
jgi:hypothetical protein